MAYITAVEDEQEHKVASLVTTHDKYLLPDGSQMFIHTAAAWCRSCNAFTLVEVMASPEELEKTARQFWEQASRNPLVPFKFISMEKQTAMAQEQLNASLHKAAQWRTALESRKSPPRCLQCSMSDYSTLPDDGSWIRHPGIETKKVRARTVAHASMAVCGGLYDVEGRRIVGRDAEP